MKLPRLFKRPEHLSTKLLGQKAVLLHHLKWMKKNNLIGIDMNI